MVTAIVTGSRSGIGLACCKLLDDLGYRVIALCRKASSELHSLNVFVHDNIDVTDEIALQKCAHSLKEEPVDLLLNVAGIYKKSNDETFARMREHFEINTLGPLKVTAAFLPLMKHGSKIGIITSRLGSIEDNTSGGRYGYRISRAGLNMLTKSLAIDLQERRIAVALIHPGRVQVKRNGFTGDIDADTAAKRIMERIDELNSANSGTFWHANGEVLPW